MAYVCLCVLYGYLCSYLKDRTESWPQEPARQQNLSDSLSGTLQKMLPDPGIKHSVLRLRDMHTISLICVVTVRGHGQGHEHMLATKLCYALGNVGSASSVTFLFVPQELDGGELPAKQSHSSLWRAVPQL